MPANTGASGPTREALEPSVAGRPIKIGLVCMGATILFSVIMKAGLIGMLQAVLVVIAVWFFSYWLGRRLGMGQGGDFQMNELRRSRIK